MWLSHHWLQCYFGKLTVLRWTSRGANWSEWLCNIAGLRCEWIWSIPPYGISLHSSAAWRHICCSEKRSSCVLQWCSSDVDLDHVMSKSVMPRTKCINHRNGRNGADNVKCCNLYVTFRSVTCFLCVSAVPCEHVVYVSYTRGRHWAHKSWREHRLRSLSLNCIQSIFCSETLTQISKENWDVK